MIYTIEQANDYSTLLDIKEHIEEKHKPKSGFNVINRMPRITIMSNIETDNKVNPAKETSSINKARLAEKINSADKATPADKINPAEKINLGSQVRVVYAPDPALARPHETAPPSFCGISNLDFGLGFASLVTLAVRVSGCLLLLHSVSVCSVGNKMTNIAHLLLLL